MRRMCERATVGNSLTCYSRHVADRCVDAAGTAAQYDPQLLFDLIMGDVPMPVMDLVEREFKRVEPTASEPSSAGEFVPR